MTKKQVLAEFLTEKNLVEKTAIGKIDPFVLISTIEKLEKKTGRQLLSYGNNPLEHLSQSVTIGEVAKLFYCSAEEERGVRMRILFELKHIGDDPDELQKLLEIFASIAGQTADDNFFNSKIKGHVVYDMPFCNWEYVVIFAEHALKALWTGPSFSRVSDDATVLDVVKMFTSSTSRCHLDSNFAVQDKKQPKVDFRRMESIADQPEKIKLVIKEIAKEVGRPDVNLDDFAKEHFLDISPSFFADDHLEMLFNIEMTLGYQGPGSIKLSDTVYSIAASFRC